MKKLLIPVIIAVLAGVGGGSGFSYMRVAKKFVSDSIQLADSLQAHPPADSTAADSSAHGEQAAHGVPDSAMIEVPAPATPADSIRALEASRETLRSSTKGVPDAAQGAEHEAPAHGAPSHDAPVKGATSAGAAPKTSTRKAAVTKPAGDAADSHAAPASHDAEKKPAQGTPSVAAAVRDARNEAMATALPEQRLAKIFGAMSAKDAAKVMEQMPDSDVRTILSMMSDRTAAAILTQFPAARAATITKGSARAPGGTP